jgi:ribosomal protein L11 methylase PrmA
MEERLRGSFRDPSGYLFRRDGVLYRSVAPSYRAHYDALLASGLYDELAAGGLLVRHEEMAPALAPGAYRVLRPDVVEFVSYPYEWCFGQLKAAALCTLAIQRRALARGMVLKDASAYNVQFQGTQPIFIDTLSFERLVEGKPWAAYRQFCEHFLVPLLLVSRVDPGLARLLRVHLDGIPLELGSRLLGARSLGSLGALVHVVMHGRSVRKYAGHGGARARRAAVSARALLALAQNLEACIRACSWEPRGTQWADYEETHGYGPASHAHKRSLVADQLRRTGAKTVWDLGANTGEYSRLAAEQGASVVAFDLDPAAVERNFRRLAGARTDRVLPLVMDAADPSPACGWDSRERLSLVERGPADAVMALALVHHLAIGRNVPFDLMAEGFARLGRFLIVEFVPKEDPQAQRLLSSRADVFDHYTPEEFERAFGAWYAVESRQQIAGTGRLVFVMGPKSQ